MNKQPRPDHSRISPRAATGAFARLYKVLWPLLLAVLFLPGASHAACVEDAYTLCLNDERFQVRLSWVDFSGNPGNARIVNTGAPDSGLFWYADPLNWELQVKVLDGCAANNKYWVLSSSATNFEYTLEVTDTVSGAVNYYQNPLNQTPRALIDTDAFNCTGGSPGKTLTLTTGPPLAQANDLTAPGSCVATSQNLCLADGRFKVEVDWRDFSSQTGVGTVVPFGTTMSGLFWFTDVDNWEVLVKVIDVCAASDRFWVLAGASTNYEYDLTVTDTLTGVVKTYSSPLGEPSSAVVDTLAFDTCDGVPPASDPVAVNDNASTPEDSAVTINVVANDYHPFGLDVFLASSPNPVVSQPGNGSAVRIDSNRIRYTPDSGFSGNDSFTYRVTASNGRTDTATVTVTVVAAPDPDPVAVNDQATTEANTPVDIDVVANDYDPDGLSVFLASSPNPIVSQPANGSAVRINDDEIRYTPDGGFTGTDTFTYRVTASDGDTDNATVTVTVEQPPPPTSVLPRHELLITALPVVNDPRASGCGPWSFCGLMTELAGTGNVSSFVRLWLQRWELGQWVGGNFIEPVPHIRPQVIDPWPRTGSAIDVSRAPFRLLAIVNRFDLATSGNFGEARMVFGFHKPNGQKDDFTVIFEYKMSTAVMSRNEWAAAWHQLAAYADQSSAGYLNQLQFLTDSFSATPVGGKITLGQIRTNDGLVFAENFFWEWREFHQTSGGALLTQTTVKQTPLGESTAAALDAYMLAHQNEILNHTHIVGPPLLLDGHDENISHGFGFYGDVVARDLPWVRLNFSQATCSGCHVEDTVPVNGPTAFFHINPRNAGQEAQISDFFRNVPLCVPRVIGLDIEPCWSTYVQNELGTRTSRWQSLLDQAGFSSTLGSEAKPGSEVSGIPEKGVLFPQALSRAH